MIPPPFGPGTGRMVVVAVACLATACVSTQPGNGQERLEAARQSGSEGSSEQWQLSTDRIDGVFAELDSTRSPGCVLGVNDRTGLRLARGYGMANLEQGVPLGPGSVFRMASVSKQFTAAVALLLERDGLLSLDDDIRQVLPELPNYGASITLRHLVHHTSGLRDYLALMSLAGRESADHYTDDDVLAMLARQQELNFAPGENHLYSNSGYFLISRIVPRLTGLSLDAYARAGIFRPLGMNRTHFHDDHTRLVQRRATGHRRTSEGRFAILGTTLDMVGDGGLFTSMEDMARWERIFIGDVEGFDGSEAAELARLLRTRMMERGVLANGDSIPYAFGLVHGRFRGLSTVEHGGSFVGFRTHVLRFPEQRVSFVVLCNLAQADPARLAREVAEIVLEDELGAPAEEAGSEGGGTPSRADAEGRRAVRPSPATAASMAGSYWSEELDVVYRLAAEGDGLVLTAPRTREGLLEPRGPDRFQLGGVEFRFVRDSAGTVSELRVGAARARNLRFVPVGDAPGRPGGAR